MTAEQTLRKWVSLVEALYALIDATYEDGDEIVRLIKSCHQSTPLYAYSWPRLKAAGTERRFFLFAVRAEIIATRALCELLRGGDVPARGAGPDGTRRSVKGDEWDVLHINIQRSELLAPLGNPHFSSLQGVRVDCGILLGKISIFRKAGTALSIEHGAAPRCAAPRKASEAELRLAYKARVESWSADKPHPSEEADIDAMTAEVGRFSRSMFRKIRKEEAPSHWLEKGRPQKRAGK